MNDIFAILVTLAILIFTVIGAVVVFASDSPCFMFQLAKQCEEVGYVQNKDMRIYCQIEKED